MARQPILAAPFIYLFIDCFFYMHGPGPMAPPEAWGRLGGRGRPSGPWGGAGAEGEAGAEAFGEPRARAHVFNKNQSINH